jgi:hypothetical protein
MLHEQRHVRWDVLGGGLVPMIRMGVSHDYRVHIQDLFHRRRQRNCRIAEVSVCRAGKSGHGVLRREHGVDQELVAAVLQDERRVSNLSDLH